MPSSGDEEHHIELLSRQELENRVHERTAYLENLMDTMVDILLVLDAEGRIQLVNEAVTTILDYDEESLIGRPIDIVFAPPSGNTKLSNVLDEGTFIERLLDEGHVKDLEIYFATRHGEAIPMSVSASLMRDDGSISGIVCVAKDISERKEAEETSEFLHSMLRHDLGNKLQITGGYLEQIRDDVPPEIEAYFDIALTSLHDAGELIENVQMLERVEGERDLKPTNVDAVLSESIARHEDLLDQQDIVIGNRVQGGYSVLADPLLKELFSNLIENALKHSGGSEVVLSATSNDETLSITIEDDGDGIPDEDKRRIFEKGVTGAKSSGSGLGTHIANRIAESYDGSLTVDDSERGGARFVVTLPLLDAD